ncbi:MAG TPA: alpha/beta fold hydrolase [Desulfuromonadales bacterium]|nr:alpha/beta fold hydrolase [Desulfuromonadales bacterium]
MTTVYFSHGKESGPWGLKIRVLARVAERFGCRVVSLDEQDQPDPEQRVRRLVEHAGEQENSLILVGSSMGGYVAAVASAVLRPRGLFLMAPAIGLPGYAVTDPCPAADEMMIVHGWADEVVPVQPVFEFARERQCPFCLLADGHRLQEQLPTLERLFQDFLRRCLEAPAVGRQQRLLACL